MAKESRREVDARVRARRADREHFREPGIRTVIVTRRNINRFKGAYLELKIERIREDQPELADRTLRYLAERRVEDDFLQRHFAVVLVLQGNRPIGFYNLYTGGPVAKPYSRYVFVRPDSRSRRVSELLTAKAHNLFMGRHGKYIRSETTDLLSAQKRSKFHDSLQAAGGLAAMRPASGTPAVVRHRDELLAMKPSRRALELSRITARLRREGKTLDALHLVESLPPSRRRIRKAFAAGRRGGR